MQNDELQRAVNEAERFRRKYLDLYNTLPVGYVSLDQGGRILDANLTTTVIFDRTTFEVVGEPLIQFVKAEDHDILNLHLRSLFALGGEPACDLRLRPAGIEDSDEPEMGSRVDEAESLNVEEGCWIRLTSRVDSNEQGKLQSRTIITDITALKRAEATSREGHYRAQRFLNVADVMIVSLDRNGKVAMVNDRACEILGGIRYQICGRNWFEEFVPEDMREEANEVFQSLMSGNDDLVRYREYPIRTLSGVERMISWNNSILADEEGRVTHALSSGKDVTDLHDLEASDRSRSILVDHVSDAVVSFDLDRRIQSWNPAAERIFGWQTDEAVGRPSEAIFASEQPFGGGREMWETLQTHGFWQVELLQRRKDGADVEVEARADWMADAEGRRVGVVAVYRDISQRQRTERLLREAEDRVQHMQRLDAVGQMAAGVAHDFKNYFATMLAQIERAIAAFGKESGKAAKRARRRFYEIQRVVNRASGLANQILLLSQNRSIKLRPLNLNAEVDELYGVLRNLGKEGITINLDLADDVRTLESDPVQLGQILMNLVTNARDAMTDGGEITIRTENLDINPVDMFADAGLGENNGSGRFVKISVLDTGPGMVQEVLEKLFEPFFTTKSTGCGSGLGLSVVRGIVEAHGGWVNVKNEPGRGCCVEVILPASDEGVFNRPAYRPADARESLEDYLTATPEELLGKGERVLVVEDEAALRMMLEEFLEEEGYDVVATASCAEASLAIENECTGPDEDEFDLLICDQTLPDGKGTDLIKGLSGKGPRLKSILISGHSDSRLRISGLDASQPVVSKPFRMAQLLREMRRVIENNSRGG